MFRNINNHYKVKNWKFLYTDASKTDNSTSFAVINSNGGTIAVGSCQQYCSVYTAEALAVLHAVNYGAINQNKYIICTDSSSTISALKNASNKSNIIIKIRNKLVHHKNAIKVMWVPGHAGIPGNENADSRAKAATNEPLMHFDALERIDVKKWANNFINAYRRNNCIDQSFYYNSINPSNVKPQFSADLPCSEVVTFTRLRIGHTILTHGHLLLNSEPPICPFCKAQSLNTRHILDSCTSLHNIRVSTFGNLTPSDLLQSPSPLNVSLINKFIKKAQLQNVI